MEGLREQFSKSAGTPDSVFFKAFVTGKELDEQGLGAHGNRAAVGCMVAFQEAEEIQKKEENGDFAVRQAAQHLADEAMHSFQTSYHDAMAFYDGAIPELERMRDELPQRKEAFDQHTVKLSTGEQVFYNQETGGWSYQDAQGDWRALEDDELEQEAWQKAEQMGEFNTEQGKRAFDKYEAGIPMALMTFQQHQAKTAEINRKIESGEIPADQVPEKQQHVDELKHNAEQIFGDIQEYDREIDGHRVRFEETRQHTSTPNEAKLYSSPNDAMAAFSEPEPDEPTGGNLPPLNLNL